VADESGQNEKIAGAVKVVLLKKEIRKITGGAQHVKEDRDNNQHFH
jgi:hypothetical protein